MAAIPTISVILPTFDRAAVVGEAVASVAGQTFGNWELIIVDDGSTDGSEAALRPLLADHRIRYIRQRHCGQSAARNHGVGEARSERIAFLDSDNLFYPGFLAAAAAALDREAASAGVYGALVSRQHGLAQSGYLLRSFDRRALEAGNFIDLNTLVCRRGLFQRIGGFDESLRKLEDWDLFLRLTRHGPLKAIPNLAAYYRVLDSIRVSDALPDGTAFEIVRKKHGLTVG